MRICDTIDVLGVQQNPHVWNLDLSSIIATSLGDKLNITAKFLKNNFTR